MINWIQSHQGNAIDIEVGAKFPLPIEEIATILSRICRFSGHCEPEYSVAEHSVYVSDCCQPEFKVAGLLHDVHEGYTGFGDVCSPAKILAPIIKKLERSIDRLVEKTFDLWPFQLAHDYVHDADMLALSHESRDIMLPHPRPWIKLPEPPSWQLIPRCKLGQESKELFLEKAKELGL